MNGELLPRGGGDPIPLLKPELRIGRRESCDIVLRFSNVSAHHCVLTLAGGYWFVTDLNSSNGVKVNGNRIASDVRKRLDPGDIISFAAHDYEIQYSPIDLGAIGPPPSDDQPSAIMNKPLLERAGLDRRGGDEQSRRYDVKNDRPGQLAQRKRNQL
jgi:adenylate cyclase